MGFFTAHFYSQTDPRWSKEKLGFSTSSIGGYGCAITAVSNLHNALFNTNITPSQMNQELKRVKAFSNGRQIGKGNLIVWTRVALAFPRLKFMYRDWNYSNSRVWSWINLSPRVPVIVCAKTNFVPQHFFLFIGGGKMVDSLDGKIKSTGTYPTLTGSARYSI
ncbi:MAG: hypothetical protein M3Q81_04475 [bacterium]|nr:hypothetical protein [bacterium]